MSNPEATAEAIESVSNLSFEELVAQRMARQTSPEEEPEEESNDSPEAEDEDPASLDDEESSEAEEESEEESEEEAEEESEIDLLSLTTEQIQSLAKKGKSRLLQRIGELTAQKKALEEKIQSQPQSQAKSIPQDENPFREVSSFDELKGKYDELERTLETTDEILEEHEDYGPDDIITVGDKEFSKKQIRKANRNAREALTKYIPAQQQHLVKIAQYEEMSKQYSEAARSEIPEIQDEESEIGKNFKALASDPLIERIKSQVPEIGFQIEYILAHAARSLYGNKKIKTQSAMGSKLKVNPSSTPFGAGAAKSSSPAKAKVADAYNRFEKSGSPEEWIAARIAKFK
jgi:uncharacterized protein YozE (UPF0346 family)